MTNLDEVINVKKDETLDDMCWICRRTRDELENMGIGLFQLDGTNFDSHTVCRACEDIIFELSPEIDEDFFEKKIRKTIKLILQDVIDSDDMETD